MSEYQREHEIVSGPVFLFRMRIVFVTKCCTRCNSIFFPHVSSPLNSIRRGNNFFCVFVIFGMALDGRFIYGYKKAATQGWTDNRNAKDTTEIINCDGSDLMSQMGNLESGTEVWISAELLFV